METAIKDQLCKGMETAYIDGNVVSDQVFRPQFLSNNYHEGRKVLSYIEDEMQHCEWFDISVAFITFKNALLHLFC